MVFSNKDIVLNLENYNQITSKFLGNYGRSSGQYFTGLDTFIMYIPLFDTDLSLENSYSNVNKEGTFEQVVMNGMENSQRITPLSGMSLRPSSRALPRVAIFNRS